MIRKLLLLSAVLVAAWHPAVARPLVELSVIDRDSSQTLPEYTARGDTWVAGVPGHRYAVRLHNRSGERVLVVLSVDGVNAVSGQTADPSQVGYVLAPWQATEIVGWRKSLDSVAQFVFTDVPDAYASRTGRPDNVGVIGIAVFREQRRVWMPSAAPAPIAQARESRAKAATADAAAPMRQRIGTGHGARESAPVGRTGFVRASRQPAQVTQLRYDDIEALVAAGIVPAHGLHARPQAFPQGFVADPPGG